MLPDIKNILYATDLSDNAGHAFRYAIFLAKKTGAHVHILHVVERLSNDAKITLRSYVLDENEREKILYERVDRAKELLDQRLKEFWKQLDVKDRGVEKQIASVNVCESYPVEEILKQAETLGCDIIVMGTHEKGFVRTFLGSVAKSVLYSSRIPTFIIPIPESA